MTGAEKIAQIRLILDEKFIDSPIPSMVDWDADRLRRVQTLLDAGPNL
jgi:hypothetical protein